MIEDSLRTSLPWSRDALGMLPLSIAGVWAATVPVVQERRWIPPMPVQTAHYFLVVSMKGDGTVQAFIRNPEFNAGAFIGKREVVVRGSEIRLSANGRPEIGGRINHDGTMTLENIASGHAVRFHRASAYDLRWFYPRASGRWQYTVPRTLRDGWPTATLAGAGMDERPIAQLMNGIVSLRTPALDSPYIHSISIARHGKLVLDEYFYGYSPQQTHDVRSAGKSVTTLMVGRAMEDTHAFSPASSVLALLNAYLPVRNDTRAKRRMTVANLMTMASGLACDDNDDASPGNEDTLQSRPEGTDWYRYTLDLPVTSEPGTRAVYCTAGINLLGAVIRTETHRSLTSYLRERFAIPMQFGTYAMWLMPPPANEAYMGGGDSMRARDFLKFGQLLLHGGRWRGRHIVDAAWIRASIEPRTAPEGEGDRYGYGWHITSVEVGGRAYRVVNAGGNGGQLMMVVPQLDVAVMVTAGNYNQYRVWRKFLPEVIRAVVRSCNISASRSGSPS